MIYKDKYKFQYCKILTLEKTWSDAKKLEEDFAYKMKVCLCVLFGEIENCINFISPMRFSDLIIFCLFESNVEPTREMN